MAQIAFMLPGQGSQKTGMGRDLVERWPQTRDRWFGPADEILGFGLTDLCFNGPDEELRQTQNTQPAIFVVSMAVAGVLRDHGIEPQAAVGHSLGEYSALVCAGVLDFEDALRLVRRRGELMAGVNERTPGAMAAVIGLDAEQVEEVCRAARDADAGLVEPANFNEPEQTVISGDVGGVEHAMALAKDAGAARVVRLPVGAPFHCSLMEPVETQFAPELDRVSIREPQIPVVANVTGDYVRTADEVRDALRRQLAGSVRWTDTMCRLGTDGYDTFIEAGPGRVLTGFSMKINPDADVHSAGEAKRIDRLLSRLGK